jgi:hypothetical protein
MRRRNSISGQFATRRVEMMNQQRIARFIRFRRASETPFNVTFEVARLISSRSGSTQHRRMFLRGKWPMACSVGRTETWTAGGIGNTQLRSAARDKICADVLQIIHRFQFVARIPATRVATNENRPPKS